MNRKLGQMAALALVVTLVVACGGPSGSDPTADVPAAPTAVRTEAGPGFVTVTWQHDGLNVNSFEITRSEVVTASVHRVTAIYRLDGHDREPRARIDREVLDTPSAGLSTAAVVGSVAADARSFVDDGVEAGTTYRYAVSALSSSGVSSDVSDQVSDPVTPGPDGGVPGDNPDPSRFLAVRVLDPAGNALPNANVEFVGAREGDSWHTSFRGETGPDGVAILADTEEDSFEEPGTYTGYLWVDPTWRSSVRQQLFAVDALSYPGTFTANPRSEDLEELRFGITGGGMEGVHYAQFAVPVADRTILAEAFYVGTLPTDVLIAPGDYPLVITSRNPEGGQVHLWDEVSVPGTPVFELDTSQVVTSRLDVSFTLAAGGTIDRAFICPRGQDDSVYHWRSYCFDVDGGSRFTPKVYEISFYGEALAPDGSYWEYAYRDAVVDLRPAGSSAALTYGGALTLSFEPTGSAYAPGDTVEFEGSLVDANGHDLRWIYIDTGDEWREAQATVTVTGPNDETVATTTLDVSDLFDHRDNGITLASTTPVGTYDYEVSLDTGPLDGLKTTTGSFEVGIP